ncbi:group III truncated hemoglobin [Rhodoblastus acidophilus]|uniref:Group III truncated hemoglobin n=1 Tax=Candidatus Rhodoblastus alkanivorans TaxID=2954117 RepID=A0ABS9Z7G1_9HYPH|nr:group III truncated hemoglobin [Candidatus Rhodoblastus alkanivorans]MCI4678346.1 group III truncated hemoglobin [Candidatus Rhodoblastus alkanivorans]MCI4683604.1 group III truncated hemoglobin [Candidatus Rhodoblastus alkanivorans]MDI4640920.1 group III truncated hemoglobin [Rhodoblastus acidophilus]
MQPRHDHSPLPAARRAGPIFPHADADEVAFAGFAFLAGDPPARAGIFTLTRRIGEFLYPVIFVEAEDMAAEAARLRADEQVLTSGLADGCFWTARDNARLRHHALRDLVGKYDPPLNEEFRMGRAAPEIAALVADRAKNLPVGEAEHGAAAIDATEADIKAMVRAFYAEALHDPLIGPVFVSHVSDWEHHFDIVQNFWSRSLLGTSRYAGSPFTPHLSMNLKPEFFDRWVALFRKNAEAHLKPAAARAAIARVEHMSVCFQAGLFPPTMPRKEPAA